MTTFGGPRGSLLRLRVRLLRRVVQRIADSERDMVTFFPAPRVICNRRERSRDEREGNAKLDCGGHPRVPIHELAYFSVVPFALVNMPSPRQRPNPPTTSQGLANFDVVSLLSNKFKQMPGCRAGVKTAAVVRWVEGFRKFCR